MAVSGGWNNFIELSLSIDEWITIEISQVNQGGKVRKTSSNILFILIKRPWRGEQTTDLM